MVNKWIEFHRSVFYIALLCTSPSFSLSIPFALTICHHWPLAHRERGIVCPMVRLYACVILYINHQMHSIFPNLLYWDHDFGEYIKMSGPHFVLIGKYTLNQSISLYSKMASAYRWYLFVVVTWLNVLFFGNFRFIGSFTIHHCSEHFRQKILQFASAFPLKNDKRSTNLFE